MRRSNHGIWLVWGITALIGTGWHFLYDWLPFQLVGMVAPVNESVWEHLKLLFWPFLLACPFLVQRGRNAQRAWGACFAAMLLMPALLLGIYYPLRAGFGVQTEMMPIVLYYLVLAAGFWITHRLSRCRSYGALGRGAAHGGWILCSLPDCILCCSAAAPHFPGPVGLSKIVVDNQIQLC